MATGFAETTNDGWGEIDSLLPSVVKQAPAHDEGWVEIDALMPKVAARGALEQTGKAWIASRVRQQAPTQIGTPSVATDWGTVGTFSNVGDASDFQSRVRNYRNSQAYRQRRSQAEQDFRKSFPTLSFDEHADRFDKLSTYYGLAKEFAANEQSAYNTSHALKHIPKEDRPEFLAVLADVVSQSEPQRGFVNKLGERVARGAIGIEEEGAEFGRLMFGAGDEDQQDFYRQAQEIRRSRDVAGRPLAQAWQEGGALGVAESGALSAAEMAPAMIVSAAAGKVTGGGVGAGARGVGLAPATAARAASLSGGAATTGYWYTQTMPGLYREFKDSGFDDDTSFTAASIAAAPIALVEQLQVSGLVRGSALTEAKQAAANTVGQWIKQQAAKSGRLYLEEFSEEAIQSLIELASLNALDAAGVDRNAIDWEKQIGQTQEELLQAAVALPFLMGPGRALEATGEAIDVRQRAVQLGDIQRDRTARQIARANPEAARAFVSSPSRGAVTRLQEATGIAVPHLPTMQARQQFAEQLKTALERRPASEPTPQPDTGLGETQPAGQQPVPQQPEAPLGGEIVEDVPEGMLYKRVGKKLSRQTPNGITTIELGSVEEARNVQQRENERIRREYAAGQEEPAEPGIQMGDVQVPAAGKRAGQLVGQQFLESLSDEELEARRRQVVPGNPPADTRDAKIAQILRWQKVTQAPSEPGTSTAPIQTPNFDLELANQPPAQQGGIANPYGHQDSSPAAAAWQDGYEGRSGDIYANAPELAAIYKEGERAGYEEFAAAADEALQETTQPPSEPGTFTEPTTREKLEALRRHAEEQGDDAGRRLMQSYIDRFDREGGLGSAREHVDAWYQEKLASQGPPPSTWGEKLSQPMTAEQRAMETERRNQQARHAAELGHTADLADLPYVQPVPNPKRSTPREGQTWTTRYPLGEQADVQIVGVKGKRVTVEYPGGRRITIPKDQLRQYFEKARGGARPFTVNGEVYRDATEFRHSLSTLDDDAIAELGNRDDLPRQAKAAIEAEIAARQDFEQPTTGDELVDAGVNRLRLRYGTDNVRVVPASETERDAADFIEQFGGRPVFIEADVEIGAATYRSPEGNIVYIQAGRGDDALWRAVADEVGHLSRAGRDVFTDAEIKEAETKYVAGATPRYREFLQANPAHLREEAEAALVAQFLTDEAFRERLRKSKRTLFERLVDIVLQLVGDLAPRSKQARTVLANLRGAKEQIRRKGAVEVIESPDVRKDRSIALLDEGAFAEGDRVTWTTRGGEQLTGTISRIDASMPGRVRVTVDQTAAPGGVPIGRIEHPLAVDLMKIEAAAQAEQPELSADMSEEELEAWLNRQAGIAPETPKPQSNPQPEFQLERPPRKIERPTLPEHDEFAPIRHALQRMKRGGTVELSADDLEALDQLAAYDDDTSAEDKEALKTRFTARRNPDTTGEHDEFLGWFVPAPKQTKKVKAGRRKSKIATAAEKAVQERDEAWDDLAQYLRKKIAPPALGADPELVMLASKVVAKSVKAGTLQFAALVDQSVERIGEELTREIAPILRQHWDTLRPAWRTATGVDIGESFDPDQTIEEIKGDNESNEGERPAAPRARDRQDMEGVPPEVRGEVREGGDVLPTRGGSTGSDGGDVPETGAAGGSAPGGGQSGEEGVHSGARPGRKPTGNAPGRNYRIAEDEQIGGGATFKKKERYRRNVAAIRTLKQIEAEGRRATPDEQATLAQYVGWGGLKEAFGKGAIKGEAKFLTPEQAQTLKGWAKEIRELRELLTEDEWQAAKASIINAHYTSPEVVRAIWQGIKAMGFEGGRVVEPSMGTGLFFGMMPDDIATRAKLQGVEMDDLTARIAKQLYQVADITHAPFQAVSMQDDTADLFISNVPFGRITVSDRHDRSIPKGSVHDFFFSKAVKKTRPGGLIVFITSRFSLDKRNSKARADWAKLGADFIGAVRLPNNAFKGIADTSVVTDIVVLQKRRPGAESGGEAFNQAVDHTDGDQTFHINEYFAQHPENILGELSYTGSMHGENELTVEPMEGIDLGKAVAEAVGRMQVSRPALEAVEVKTAEAYVSETRRAPEGFREAGLLVRDGKLWQNEGGKLVELAIPYKGKGSGLKNLSRIEKALELYDTAEALVQAEVDASMDEAAVENLRKQLNQQYDRFTRKYKPLNTKYNYAHFSQDPLASSLLMSLENWDEDTQTATKADIFTKRVRRPRVVKTSAETPEEALAASLAEKGRVDAEYVGKLLSTTPEDAIQQLGDAVFLNPQGDYEPASQYLSGNVRDKLRVAKERAKDDPRFQRNVTALEKVQPEDLGPGQIDVRLGAPWVPADVYSQFVDELLTKPVDFKYVRAEGTWVLTNQGNRRPNEKERIDYGTEDIPALDLIEKDLNHREIVVRRRQADGSSVVDDKATSLARSRLEKVRRAFADWIFAEPQRAERLVRLYNDQFNNTVAAQHDGSHLTLPGMADHVRNLLNPHQKAAIARFLTGGNMGLFHVVGAGKSWTMAAQIMEGRRLGITGKPIVVLPNHLIRSGQFAREFRQAYPAAKLLVATSDDLKPAKRQTLVQRVRTGDWDAVLIAHSSFEKIPVSPDIQRKFFQQQIDALEEDIREAKKGKDRSYEAELEAAKQRLEEQLARLSADWKKDNGPFFDELGVDGLWVDEAHEFKNLWFRTKMGRVPGVQPTFVQKSFDMHQKTEYLNAATGGRGIVFATGTPVANSISEMYTMLRYLAPGQLSSRGIESFDAWADTFGRVVTDVEINPTGRGVRMHSRFAQFANVPELMQMFGAFADVQTAEDLKEVLGRPEMRGGKPTTVQVPTNDYLKTIVADLVKRAERVRGGQVDPTQDNMLAITTDGRKAALDIRLIDPNLPDMPDSKINRAAENIARVWRDTTDRKGTQIVWMDMTSPTTKGPVNLYHELRDKLVAAGIPRKEIAIIHEHEKKADDLFRKVRAGDVRVLMGSTKKMGTGVNVQTRLVASHHLDPPWRPADVEQRDGRILRRGNQNDLVDIYQYVTNASFDAYMWQTLERKLKAITTIMAGDVTTRKIEDVGKQILSYGEIKAAAAEDPRLMEYARLESDVRSLEAEASAHRDEQFRLGRAIQYQEQELAQYRDSLPKLKADAEKYEKDKAANPDFSAVIDGTTYDKPKEAGEALQRKLNDIGYDSTGWQTVAHVRGFAVQVGVRAGFEESPRWLARVVGQEAHDFEFGTDAVGNMTRIGNVMEKMRTWADHRERHEIPDTEARIKEMKQRVDRKFEKADELQEKAAKLEQLRTALQVVDEPSSEKEGEEGGASAFKPRRAPSGGSASAMSAQAAANAPAPTSARTTPDPFQQPPKAATTGKPISNHEIAKRLGELFKVPIRFGNFRVPDAAGIYKHVVGKEPAPQVVRVAENFIGDLSVIAHEIAHHIDRLARVDTGRKGVLGGARITGAMRAELKNLDYDQEKRRTHEGFAEFIRHLLTEDNAELKAPQFYRWFTQVWLPVNPQQRANLVQGKQLINRWRFQGAEKRVRSARSTTGEVGTLREKATVWWRRLQSWFVEDLGGIARAMEELRKHKDIPAGSDPYTMARVLKNREGALAWDAANHGVRSLVTGKRIGPSLLDALKLLGDFTTEEYEQFVDFLHARHALDVLRKGKNPGISQADAQFVYDKHKSKAKWVKAADIVTAWNKAHIEMLVEAGALTPDAGRLIVQSYPAYIPLKRVVDSLKANGVKSGFVNVKAPVKRLKGSGRQIIDPFTAMMQSSIQMHAAAAKMMIGRRIIELAETVEGMGWMAEKIPAPTQTTRVKLARLTEQLEAAGADLSDADLEAILSITQASGFYRGGEPVAFIVRNGRPQWYQFDPDLYQDIAGMDILRLPMWMEVAMGAMSLPTKVKRLGAVGLRASFGLGMNPIRDLPHAAMQTEGASFQTALRTVGYNVKYGLSLLAEARGKEGDPVSMLYHRYGGVLSTYVGQDIKQTHKQVRELINNAQGRQMLNIVSHPLEALQTLFSLPEMAPRLAEVQNVIEAAGYTVEDLKNDRVPMDVQMAALLAGNEITIDFSRAGSFMRQWNRVSAFSNVAVQGPVQALRKSGVASINPAKWSRKRIARTLLRGTVLLTLPTLLYWWRVKDEEWYRELPAWRRFFFWNFRLGGRTWSIPRPFEYGLVFSAIPEAIADSTYRGDAKRVGQLAEENWKGMPGASSMVPDAILVPAELTPEAGYDSWRQRQIIPAGSEHLEPRDRYFEFNTEASKRLGDYFNASPAKIDHAIHSSTGGLGTDILRIFDEGPWRALGYGRFARAFGYGETVDEFYGRREEVIRQYQSAKLKDGPGEALAAEYDRLQEFSDLIADVRNASRGIDDEAERQTYQNYITGLARQALKKPSLEEFPSLFTVDDLPTPLLAIRNDYLGRKGMEAAAPDAERGKSESNYRYTQRRLERLADIQAAVALLHELDVDEDTLESLVRLRARGRGYNPDTAATWAERLKERF